MPPKRSTGCWHAACMLPPLSSPGSASSSKHRAPPLTCTHCNVTQRGGKAVRALCPNHPGSVDLVGQDLVGLWISWLSGSCWSVDLVGVWILLALWILWIHVSQGSIELAGMWFLWIHESCGPYGSCVCALIRSAFARCFWRCLPPVCPSRAPST